LAWAPRVAAISSNAAATSPSVCVPASAATGAVPSSSSARVASPRSPSVSERSRSTSRAIPVAVASASYTVAPPTLVVRMSWRGKTSPEKKRVATLRASSPSAGK
jgi:hypothetical protein